MTLGSRLSWHRGSNGFFTRLGFLEIIIGSNFIELSNRLSSGKSKIIKDNTFVSDLYNLLDYVSKSDVDAIIELCVIPELNLISESVENDKKGSRKRGKKKRK
jgi:hypothetical protein